MIIWYPANFMPVVKKQSHLCVTSIIITSGLFITMNNEHSLCLWQCSLHNLTNGFSLSSGRLSYEVHEFDCGQAMLSCEQITVNGSNPGSGRKYQNYFYPMVRRGEVSVFIVQPSPRRWAWPRVTCHVSATCRAARHNTDHRHQQHSSHQERPRCQEWRGPINTN